MSGHSKWANIKHKKGKADALRGKITTKISREITIAVRMGGSDPTGNMKLKLALSKARANNIPKDNIQRAIQKGAGALEGQSFEEITYEGYGPSGDAIIVETMTDNRNRTASEVRHYFDKYGGNMGATGCVSWSFDKKGVIVINDEDQELEEDKVMEDALEAGAADFAPDEGVYTVYTDPAPPAGQTRSRCCRSHPRHAPEQSPQQARRSILAQCRAAAATSGRPAARHSLQTPRCHMGSTTSPAARPDHSRLQQHRAHSGAWFRNFQLWMP